MQQPATDQTPTQKPLHLTLFELIVTLGPYLLTVLMIIAAVRHLPHAQAATGQTPPQHGQQAATGQTPTQHGQQAATGQTPTQHGQQAATGQTPTQHGQQAATGQTPTQHARALTIPNLRRVLWFNARSLAFPLVLRGVCKQWEEAVIEYHGAGDCWVLPLNDLVKEKRKSKTNSDSIQSSIDELMSQRMYFFSGLFRGYPSLGETWIEQKLSNDCWILNQYRDVLKAGQCHVSTVDAKIVTSISALCNSKRLSESVFDELREKVLDLFNNRPVLVEIILWKWCLKKKDERPNLLKSFEDKKYLKSPGCLFDCIKRSIVVPASSHTRDVEFLIEILMKIDRDYHEDVTDAGGNVIKTRYPGVMWLEQELTQTLTNGDSLICGFCCHVSFRLEILELLVWTMLSIRLPLLVRELKKGGNLLTRVLASQPGPDAFMFLFRLVSNIQDPSNQSGRKWYLEMCNSHGNFKFMQMVFQKLTPEQRAIVVDEIGLKGMKHLVKSESSLFKSLEPATVSWLMSTINKMAADQ